MAVAEYEATPREVRNFAITQIALTAGFLLLLYWALGGSKADLPPWWMFLVLIAPTIASTFFAERVWLSASPLDPAADPEDNHAIAVSTFAAQSVRRLMYCEAPIIFAVLAAFLSGWAAWPLVIGGVPALVVMGFEVWPSLRNISMTAAMLELKGAESGLMESFRDL